MEHDYEKQAIDFLEKHNATIKIEKAHYQAAPIWIKPGEPYGFMYKITITRPEHGNPFKFNFWGSIYNREQIELSESNPNRLPIHKSPKGYAYPGEFNYLSALGALKKDVKEGKYNPTAYDILACLTKYDVGDLEDFCSDFEYDTDSKKATETYLAVVKEWKNVERLFSDCLEELQEIS